MIRETATNVLGNFVIQSSEARNTKEINKVVLNHLEDVLKDVWWGTRANAIGSILNAFGGKNIIGLSQDAIERALKLLEGVSKNDVHAEVREATASAIKKIKESKRSL